MGKNFDEVKASSAAFSKKLKSIKSELDVRFAWYPYDTMANFLHIDKIVPEEFDFLFTPKKRYADFGAADGDLSFYLESLGNDCDIYDNGPTNMNGLRGARRMRRALNSQVNIVECDLDTQFDVSSRYDLIFVLGILYHLKNPFFVLEKLSIVSPYLLLSTKVARHFRAGGLDVSAVPAAYLVGPAELNNDPTNFWIFSEAGLQRIIDRTGWDLVGYRTVGDTIHSNPSDNDCDERAFAFLKSRRVFR
jgi:tRNA (mo5U34)-methyltransferase